MRIKLTPIPCVIFCLTCLTLTQVIQASEQKYYHQTGHLRGSLIEDAPAPVYSDNPNDRWNVIFHLLYTRKIKVPVSSYFYKNPKPIITVEELKNNPQWDNNSLISLLRSQRFGQSSGFERIVGGDVPEFYMRDRSGDYLVESPRYESIVEILSEELQHSTVNQHNLIARVLFQQDLWNRYDLLFNTKDIKPENQPRVQNLLSLLGRLIKAVSPREKELKALTSNYNKIAQSHPEIDDRLFDKNTPWREILSISGTSVNTAADEGTTTHAFALGHRRVFRVFLKGPDDKTSAACLEDEIYKQKEGIPQCVMWNQLAFGSKAMLVETPVVITKAGRLISLPLEINVQTRFVAPINAGDDDIYGFDDHPFAVFHARRRDLIRFPKRSAGLEKLASDTPVPRNFSAFTTDRKQTLVPLHSSCAGCHTATGSSIMMSNRHGVKGYRVLHPDNVEMQKRVIHTKQNQEDFKSLLEHFD